MKYTITINQLVLSKHLTADIIDGAILDYIFFLCSSTNKAINSQRLSDPAGAWTWINLETLAQDMPLLHIKDKSAVSRRLLKLEGFGYIQGRTEKRLNKKFIRLTPAFDELLLKNNTPVDTEQHPQAEAVDTEQQGSGFKTTNNGTNDYGITDYNSPDQAMSPSPEREKERAVSHSEILQDTKAKKTYSDIEYLLNLSDIDVQWFTDKFPGVDAEEVRRQGERAYHNIQGRGAAKKYKNFQSVLRNWLDSPYNKKTIKGGVGFE